MSAARRAPRALTLDYWNTLLIGAVHPERTAFRWTAFRALLAAVGCNATDAQLHEAIDASGEEAERWWSEEHRGYTSAERIHWMLRRLGVERPDGCEHVARACAAVDDALMLPPPEPVPGAVEAVRALAERYPLAIVSDSGFASGRAQDRVLAHAGLMPYFPTRIYSVDVGWAKPRREPFAAAVTALGVAPHEALHIGDIERTDVLGALAAGMRALRLDVMRDWPEPTASELAARSWAEAVEYLLGLADDPKGV